MKKTYTRNKFGDKIEVLTFETTVESQKYKPFGWWFNTNKYSRKELILNYVIAISLFCGIIAYATVIAVFWNDLLAYFSNEKLTIPKWFGLSFFFIAPFFIIGIVCLFLKLKCYKNRKKGIKEIYKSKIPKSKQFA